MFYLKHTLLILLGCFLAALTFVIVADLPESGSPLSDRLLVGGIITFMTLLAFAPAFELVRSRLTGSTKSLWAEMNEMIWGRVAREKIKLANESPEYRRKARIKSIITISIFCGYILGAHWFTKNNIYEFSDATNMVLWAVIFPVLSILFVYRIIKKKYEKHVGLFIALMIFFAAFMITPLMFYLDIIINKTGGVHVTHQVTIESVDLSACDGSNTCLCDEKISVHDQDRKLHSVCLKHVSFGTLLDGDVAYIDDGKATIELVVNQFGSYVKGIVWHRKYNSTDRQWSVEDQKYYY